MALSCSQFKIFPACVFSLIIMHLDMILFYLLSMKAYISYLNSEIERTINMVSLFGVILDTYQVGSIPKFIGKERMYLDIRFFKLSY